MGIFHGELLVYRRVFLKDASPHQWRWYEIPSMFFSIGSTAGTRWTHIWSSPGSNLMKWIQLFGTFLQQFQHLFFSHLHLTRTGMSIPELEIDLFLPCLTCFLKKTHGGSIDKYHVSLEMSCFPGLQTQLRSLLWPLLHLVSLPLLSFGARCWSQRHLRVYHGCHQRRRCFGSWIMA